MNKIYLDKLCEFTLTTHKNYEINTKNFNLDEIINSVKQNNSLNEKGLFLKHIFVDLKSIIPSMEYDQIILINPLCFNLFGNIDWFNFLNAILTVLNDNYLYESNLIKKTFLETADKTYKKKLMIENTFDDKIIENVCVITNIILILISSSSVKIYNYDKNNCVDIKVVVLLCYNNIQYYPVINWNKKYFNLNSQFISYLIDNSLKFNTSVNLSESGDFIKVNKNKNKKYESKINDNFINDFDKNSNTNNKNTTTNNKNTTNKNTNTSTKNIFSELDQIDELNELDEIKVKVKVKENSNNNKDDKSKIFNQINKISHENNENNEHQINIDEFNNLLETCDTNSKNKKNKKLNINDTNIQEDNIKDCYKELTTNENYAIYISEAIDNNVDSKKNISIDTKKKNKKGKNIFVTNQNNDIEKDSIDNVINQNNVINDDSSTFIKTEKITKKDIDEIINNLKPTLNLEQIQQYAIKLGINIFEGATKTGKPKNKTKSELIENIKDFCKK